MSVKPSFSTANTLALLNLVEFFKKTAKVLKHPYYTHISDMLHEHLMSDLPPYFVSFCATHDLVVDLPNRPTKKFVFEAIHAGENPVICREEDILAPNGDLSIYGDWQCNWEYDENGEIKDTNPDYILDENGKEIIVFYGPRSADSIAMMAIRTACSDAIDDKDVSLKNLAARMLKAFYDWDKSLFDLFCDVADCYDNFIEENPECAKAPHVDYRTITERFDIFKFGAKNTMLGYLPLIQDLPWEKIKSTVQSYFIPDEDNVDVPDTGHS
jgi:hypothetical protein